MKNSTLARRGTAVLIGSLVAGALTMLLSSWVNSEHWSAVKHNAHIYKALTHPYDDFGITSSNYEEKTCNETTCSKFTTWEYSEKTLTCNEYDNAFYGLGNGNEAKEFLDPYSKADCEKKVDEWKSSNRSVKMWHAFKIAAIGLNIISLLAIFSGFGTVLFAGLRALWGKTE